MLGKVSIACLFVLAAIVGHYMFVRYSHDNGYDDSTRIHQYSVPQGVPSLPQ